MIQLHSGSWVIWLEHILYTGAYSLHGRLEDAVALREHIVTMKIWLRCDEHSSTLMSLHILACVYSRQRRYQEAAALKEVLLTKRLSLGQDEDHRHTIWILNNLVLDYYHLGETFGSFGSSNEGVGEVEPDLW